MKKFLFLTFGFEQPTPELMGAFERWFGSVADRMVDRGGLWGGGREITKDGVAELPFGKDSLTGFIIFNAESLDEAEEIARECPVISSNRIYEIMTQ